MNTEMFLNQAFGVLWWWL